LRPVALGEISARPAEEEQPQCPAGSGRIARTCRQGQHEGVVESERLIDAAPADRTPLPGRVEIPDLDDAAQVTGPVGIAAQLAVPEVLPAHRAPIREGGHSGPADS